MASSKRIGLFWGENKITLVEFGKNTPLQTVSSPLDFKLNALSTGSTLRSNVAEETQIAAIFKRMLQDNKIAEDPFYVSLPMKEIILRSFVIPFLKREEIQNAIKFEARKYLPIDIQDLNFVFYTVPFTENATKRLQVIFFAVRKELLERYERILKQDNVAISYCEPCMVSLIKVLLFRKEISLTDHLAFLILDKNSGSICFVDQGIPQFIREFPLSSRSPSEETEDPGKTLSLRIVNEVENSFDFYARQFSGDPVEQVLVLAEDIDQDLFNILETELKIKLRKVSPVVTIGALSKSNDMDAIYAMGACVEPPLESLSGFNFLGGPARTKLKTNLIEALESYKDVILVFLICVIFLVGVYVFFQAQSKTAQQQYAQLSSKQGAFLNVPVGSIQDELRGDIDKLAAYKNIRTKSDMAFILLRVASHLPRGALLQTLNISYDQGDSNDAHVTIEMKGDVVGGAPNRQIAVVNRIFSDFKNDKELSRFIKSVSLVSLNREELDGKSVTGFNIHCS